MTDLKKYINEHRDEFDDAEPAPGHSERFRALLDNRPVSVKPGINRFAMLKVAALILLLITVSVFLFDLAGREIRERFISEKPGEELPAEIRDAVQYYNDRETAQLGKLDKLAAAHKGNEKVRESANQEIRKLNDATAELTKMLSENPGDQRILDAIVQNQQMKEAVLNTIINQLSQTK
jgi:hypothetical protein